MITGTDNYPQSLHHLSASGTAPMSPLTHTLTHTTSSHSEDCSRPGACFLSDINKMSNLKGTVAFAANVREDLCTNTNPRADVCTDPGKGGLVLTNEIFINTIDNPQYDTVGGTGFAAFGNITNGMDGMDLLLVKMRVISQTAL